MNMPIKPQNINVLTITHPYSQKNQMIVGEAVLDHQRVRYHYQVQNELPFKSAPVTCMIKASVSPIVPARNFHQFDYQQYA